MHICSKSQSDIFTSLESLRSWREFRIISCSSFITEIKGARRRLCTSRSAWSSCRAAHRKYVENNFIMSSLAVRDDVFMKSDDIVMMSSGLSGRGLWDGTFNNLPQGWRHGCLAGRVWTGPSFFWYTSWHDSYLKHFSGFDEHETLLVESLVQNINTRGRKYDPLQEISNHQAQNTATFVAEGGWNQQNYILN